MGLPARRVRARREEPAPHERRDALPPRERDHPDDGVDGGAQRKRRHGLTGEEPGRPDVAERPAIDPPGQQDDGGLWRLSLDSCHLYNSYLQVCIPISQLQCWSKVAPRQLSTRPCHSLRMTVQNRIELHRPRHLDLA